MSSPNDIQKQASLKTSDAAFDMQSVTLDAVVSPTRGIYVGVTGNVSVVMTSGQTVVLTALAAGMIHPISVTKVNSGGDTTATNILLAW